ncbi:MAG: PadR family transcriptional regulator [Actinobacteria bacterium]|nr:PadR family transcriptional regulator [Actinomycetota bacterium]
MCNERTGRSTCAGPGHFMGHFFEGGHGITRRFLRPVVLLLLAESPCHGYELMGRLKELGMDQSSMDPSILYRMLRHMEREGQTESSLNDSGAGPARKVYQLTPEGREVLDLWAGNIEGIVSFLEEFKNRYEKLGK